MNYSSITYPDVSNGLGCRVTLFVSGCQHHCPGCHNKVTWDPNYGGEFDEEVKNGLFEILSLPYIKGLTLSGGDPMFNLEDTLKLLEEVKSRFPDKDVWLYTGFELSQFNDSMKRVLPYIDYLVDGPFVMKLRNTKLAFRGSENQHIWKKNESGEFVLDEKLNLIIRYKQPK